VAPTAQRAPQIPELDLIRLIGSGSYGDVWLARGVTGVFRAVKIVWRDRFNDPRPYAREFEGITRFAEISLREPSQLALLHAGRHDAAGFFYYVMELADDAERGRDIDPASYVPLTLKELGERRGQIPCAEVVELGVALARALASLHSAGLVHRDIKPSNIVFVGGVPKLADVGLVAEASAALTFVGTEGFVPLEGPGAPAADVFSLGKVLYELATGLDRQDYPRLPPNLADRADRRALLELNEVLVRACEPDARNRFADAGALLDELLLLQAGKSVRRLRSAERATARALRVAAVLAVIAVVAGAGAYVEYVKAEKAVAERIALSKRATYSANLASAQRSLETGDFGTARRLLQALIAKPAESDLRNFEWHALWNEAQGDAAAVLRDQGPLIQTLLLSDDGRFVAGQSLDGLSAIWDTTSLRRAKVISGMQRLAGFSADGAWLLGTDADSRLRRWSVGTGESDSPAGSGSMLAVGRTGPSGVLAVALDQNRRLDHLQIWDSATRRVVATGELRLENRQAWSYVSVGTVSPDGTKCALNFRLRRPEGNVWRVQVYELPSLRFNFENDYPTLISALSFSHDGQRLAVAANTNEFQMKSSATGAVLWQQTIDANGISAVAFSPDDRVLAVGGRNSVVHLLSANRGERVGDLRGLDGAAARLAWSQTGNELFSASSRGEIRRWVTPTHSSRLRFVDLQPAPLKFRNVCMSDDGSCFAALDGANQIAISAVRQGQPFDVIRLPGIAPLAFAAGGTELLALSANGRVMRWPLNRSLEPKVALQLKVDPSTAIAGASVSRNQDRLVAVDSIGGIQFWDVPRQRLLGIGSYAGFIGWTLMAPSGDIAVTTAGDHPGVQIWSVETATVLAEWGDTATVVRAAFAPDQRSIAFCNIDGEVEIRDARSFRILRRWKPDNSTLESLVYSRDGTRLFCGGSNGVVHVCDTSDWSEVAALQTIERKKGDPTVACLAISGQGNALLAYREDGLARAWQLAR
jgi:WD40 repeat protein